MATDSELLDDLLQRWEEMAEAGREASPAELCENHPHLLPELERRVEGLKALDWMKNYQSSTDPLDREPVPGYRLISKLGQGGFGQVWKALSPTGEAVAVKVVESAGEVSSELRVVGRLQAFRHPNVLPILGMWKTEKGFALVMELADGSLMDRFLELRDKGMTSFPADVLHRHLREAAAGIDALHAQGLTHRDVKPQNLLLVGGVVKVADFGLAKALDRSQTGHTGVLTPSYAAPEHFSGQTTKEGDQYSLAATYYHLRCGRPPFEGTPAEVMAGHLRRQPDLSQLPEKERPVVARALAKRPRDRWPSCSAFVDVLVGCTAHKVPDEHTAPLPLRGQHRRRFLLAFCLGAATGPLWRLRPRERQQEGPSGPVEGPTFAEPVFVFDGKSCITTPLERFAPVTLEAWVFPKVPYPGPRSRYIIGSDVTFYSGISLGLRYDHPEDQPTPAPLSPPRLMAQFLAQQQRTVDFMVADQVLPHDRWSHVAAVFFEDKTLLYLDGQKVASGPPTASKPGSPFVVGCAGRDNPQAFFRGLVLCVRISKGVRYRQAFEPSQRLMPDETTVLLYEAGSTTKGRAIDLSGKANHGTLEGVTVQELKQAEGARR